MLLASGLPDAKLMGDHLMTFRLSCAAIALAAGVSSASATVIPSQPPFQPTPAYAQLPVGATSSRVALPSGSVIAVYNTGSNPAFVVLGNSSVVATASGDQVAPGGFLCQAVGSATYLAAIETAGTTSINISGGAGICAGSGGGGGGGGSLAFGAGATDSMTQRVTEASDSPTAPWANPLSTASLQRYTENTGNYTANTGWNNSGASTFFTFTNACRVNGGAVLIPEIDIYSSANPTTKLQGILWLFSSSIGTVIADNATFNIAAADFPNVTGPMQGIAFTLGSSQASGAANSAAAIVGTAYEAKCAAGTTSIYGMVQVVNAYAKANGETLTIKLRTIGIN